MRKFEDLTARKNNDYLDLAMILKLSEKFLNLVNYRFH